MLRIRQHKIKRPWRIQLRIAECLQTTDQACPFILIHAIFQAARPLLICAIGNADQPAYSTRPKEECVTPSLKTPPWRGKIHEYIRPQAPDIATQCHKAGKVAQTNRILQVPMDEAGTI